MRHLMMMLSLVAVCIGLAACSMDTTGGFNHGGQTMNGKPVYDPDTIPLP